MDVPCIGSLSWLNLYLGVGSCGRFSDRDGIIGAGADRNVSTHNAIVGVIFCNGGKS